MLMPARIEVSKFQCHVMSSQLVKTLNFPKIMADLFGGFPKVNYDSMLSEIFFNLISN